MHFGASAARSWTEVILSRGKLSQALATWDANAGERLTRAHRAGEEYLGVV